MRTLLNIALYITFLVLISTYDMSSLLIQTLLFRFKI